MICNFVKTTFLLIFFPRRYIINNVAVYLCIRSCRQNRISLWNFLLSEFFKFLLSFSPDRILDMSWGRLSQLIIILHRVFLFLSLILWYTPTLLEHSGDVPSSDLEERFGQQIVQFSPNIQWQDLINVIYSELELLNKYFQPDFSFLSGSQRTSLLSPLVSVQPRSPAASQFHI